MLRYSDDEVGRLKSKILQDMYNLTGNNVVLKQFAMLLALFNRASKVAARFTGVSRRSLDRWLAFEMGADKGVDPYVHKGFRSKLQADQQYKLRQTIRATLAGTRHHGQVDSPEALRAFIHNNFEISYSSRQARRIFKRILSDLHRDAFVVRTHEQIRAGQKRP
jgi:transposase